MPKRHSSTDLIKVLEAQGFTFVSQKGSHTKYRKVNENSTATVIIPTPRKEIPIGTFRSIVRQSKLDITDFE
jgi:predicted RNA binding protein YcfA (HicA-like mRNA interferase family)